MYLAWVLTELLFSGGNRVCSQARCNNRVGEQEHFS